MKPAGRCEPDLHVVLVEPRIPPNTGNVARLCAALEIPLHLVGRLGFELSDRYLRRAGLDYWEFVDVRLHPSPEDFFHGLDGSRVHLFTRRGSVLYTAARYQKGDYLVFGSETEGLPLWVLETFADRHRRIPIRSRGVRSLNLSSAVAAATYEAVRQIALFEAP